MSLRFFPLMVAVLPGFSPLLAAEPLVKVPMVQGDIKIDGEIKQEEWTTAATIRRIHTLGDKALANPPSVFRLQYDNEALYVAAHLSEDPKRELRAATHKTTDDLSAEDDVQVVLGLADEYIATREILNMGGYEGAMNAMVTAADHYYQFTTNAVGSMARAYNETPLDHPLFESKTKRVADGWDVEMKIPFSSWGMKDPAGKSAFINLFRFRPPEMTAWTLPSFGGYSAMPLGRIKFLSAEGTSLATHDQEMVEEAISPSTSATPAPKFHPELIGNIGYYPLSGEIIAQIGLAEVVKDGTCVLESDGAKLESWPLDAAPDQTFRATIPKGSQPARKVVLKVLDQNGKNLLEKKQSLAAVQAPEWLGSKAGQDYVNKRVPTPWKTPVVTGNQVQLAQADLGIGASGLFGSIKDDLGEFLAGDAIVEIVQDGRLLEPKYGQVETALDGYYATTRTSWAAGPGRVELQSRIDYDGFTEVKFRLRDLDPKSVDRVTLSIPIKPENARFVHQVLVQQIKQLTGVGYNFSEGPLWVGSQDKGINFSYDDVNPFLSKSSDARLRVVESGQVTKLEVDLVDQKGQLTDIDHVFRFFLQPTPSRPRSLEHGVSKVHFYWEQWATKQGAMEFDKIPMIRQWTDGLAKKGLLGAIYTTQGLAEDTEDWQKYAPDLQIQPPWICYRRGYEPGLNVPVYGVCRRGPDGDRMLYGLKKFVDEANIGGICDDGMSLAWVCNNPSHPPGCGEAGLVRWDGASDTRMLRQRDFLKRVRGVFDETGKPYVLSAHAGGGLDISTLSFFDGYMEGEQLARFRPGYHIPLGLFSVGYNGQPWGFRTRFWDKTWRRDQGYYWSFAYVLLHGGDYEDSTDLYDIVKDFQDAKTTVFHPYWRPGQYVKVQSDHAVFSYFKKSDSALVTVGNMDYKQDDITIDFSQLFPGQSIRVQNVLAADAPVTLPADQKLQQVLLPWQCASYRVDVVPKPSDAKSASFDERGFSAARWAVTGRQNGVTSEVLQDSAGTDAGIHLTSTLMQDRASVEWTPETPSSTFSGRLTVVHSGRLEIQFGDAKVFFDSSWQMSGFTGGHLFSPLVQFDKPVEISFSIQNGRLDISYDHKPLARGLSIAGSVDSVRINTWAGDTLDVLPISIKSSPEDIYEPVEGKTRVALAAPAEKVDVTSYDPSQWKIESPSKSTDSGDKIQLQSTTGVGATAEFSAATLGDNATVSLLVNHTGRLGIDIGQGGFQWDYTWAFTGPLAGWSKGRLYSPVPELKKPVLITISIRGGLWTAMYGDRVLMKDVDFAAYQKSGNRLRIKTWAGDSATIEVKQISSDSKTLLQPSISHPVL